MQTYLLCLSLIALLVALWASWAERVDDRTFYEWMRDTNEQQRRNESKPYSPLGATHIQRAARRVRV